MALAAVGTERLGESPDMTADVVRRRVIVRGRVQGVFFRDSIRGRAEEHGVTGWVRNRPDGALEAVFEGPRGDVDALVRFSETGPPQARVEGIETTDEELGGETDFRVR
ncbi:MAG TPA: acylphosphatase [Solirubrobacteraceae bacterium]|jgi:acylphosphatase|nr:acylphosphatase [Solirubrobacteraceae bacterium]